MTQNELKTWLTEHGLGYTEFTALVNDARRERNLPPIKPKTVSSWLYDAGRKPKDFIVEYLPIIAARLKHPDAHRILCASIPLSEADYKALKRKAKQQQTSPHLLLEKCLRAGFDAECGK